MVGRKGVTFLITSLIMIFFFSFISPLAAVSGQPSLFEMLGYYRGIFGRPDYLLIEYDVYHPTKWVKRTYIWEGELLVIFLWRKGMGWIVLKVYDLRGTLLIEV